MNTRMEILSTFGRMAETLERREVGAAGELQQQIATYLEENDFLVELEVGVVDRGDGHSGRVDIRAIKGGCTVVIEVDRVRARQKSLVKLRGLSADIRVVILRTGPAPDALPEGIDLVVPMYWPREHGGAA